VSRTAIACVSAVLALAVAALAMAAQDPAPSSPATTGPTGPTAARGPALPAPDAALPADGRAAAAALTRTVRALRREIAAWSADGDPATGTPTRAVTLLALHHQRLHRLLVSWSRSRADAAVALLPDDVRGEVRDTLAARRAIAAIPRSGKPPRVRTTAPEPAGVLREAYDAAERRFGVPWSVLAAVNFVESAFGRVRSASEAGARGPMQFLPATWKAYGLGGDVEDAGDAILGAANYLRRSGAPRDLGRALFAYNRSTDYVRAIRTFARRMAADERVYLTYYAWQVYARTPQGVRRLTGPGLS